MAEEDDLATDATPIEDTAPAARAAPRRSTTRRLTVFLSLFVFVSFATAFFVLTGGGSPEVSNLPTGSGSIKTTPGGEQQASSPQYRESLAQANREGFEAAVDRGDSFLPTPEVIPSDIQIADPTTPRPFTAPPEPEAPPQTGDALPAPIVLPPQEAPKTPAAPTPAAASPQLLPPPAPAPDPTLYVQYMAKLVQRMDPRASGTQGPNVEPAQPQQGPGAPPAAGTPVQPPNSGQPPPQQELETLIRPGDFLYAETINASTSDLPSPVLATVVTGNYRDARLIGAFTVPQNADGMLVQFSSITFPDGRSAPINAYAIDPRTASAEVASGVDRRWLERFGPIMAASFVSGFAQSAAVATGTVTTHSDGSTQTVVDAEKTTRQNVAAGLSEVGQGISQVIRDSAPVGPEITLASGTGLAILFVNAVALPKQQAEDDPS